MQALNRAPVPLATLPQRDPHVAADLGLQPLHDGFAHAPEPEPAEVIAEMVTEPTAMCSTAAMAHTISSGAAVLAVKYSPRMSPRPAALMVAASEPPTPVRMRICPLSLNPVAIACWLPCPAPLARNRSLPHRRRASCADCRAL